MRVKGVSTPWIFCRFPVKVYISNEVEVDILMWNIHYWTSKLFKMHIFAEQKANITDLNRTTVKVYFRAIKTLKNSNLFCNYKYIPIQGTSEELPVTGRDFQVLCMVQNVLISNAV